MLRISSRGYMRHSFKYKTILPPESIRKYVEYYWFGQVFDNNGEKFVHLMTAQKSTQIIFFIDGIFRNTSDSKEVNKQGDIKIFGQGVVNKKIEIISSFSSIFGVKLTPIAIPLLFSLPASEITNLSFELKELCNSSVTDLAKLIQDTNNYEVMTQMFNSFVFDKLNKKDENKINDQILILTNNNDTNSIRLSDTLGFSQRHCERIFRETVGFNTRLYSKILRFENCLNKITKKTNNFTDVALNSGYYDQAHFNHDFKHFSGFTPTQYVSYLNEYF